MDVIWHLRHFLVFAAEVLEYQIEVICQEKSKVMGTTDPISFSLDTDHFHCYIGNMLIDTSAKTEFDIAHFETTEEDPKPFWRTYCNLNIDPSECGCDFCVAQAAHEEKLLEDTYNFLESVTPVTLCAICSSELREGEALAENPVYKLGELNYIELAHVDCAPDSWEK